MVTEQFRHGIQNPKVALSILVVVPLFIFGKSVWHLLYVYTNNECTLISPLTLFWLIYLEISYVCDVSVHTYMCECVCLLKLCVCVWFYLIFKRRMHYSFVFFLLLVKFGIKKIFWNKRLHCHLICYHNWFNLKYVIWTK